MGGDGCMGVKAALGAADHSQKMSWVGWLMWGWGSGWMDGDESRFNGCYWSQK